MKTYFAEKTLNNWIEMKKEAPKVYGLRIYHYYQYDENKHILIDRPTFPGTRTYKLLMKLKQNKDLYNRYSNGPIEVRYDKEFLNIYFKKKHQYEYVHYDRERRHYYPIIVDKRSSRPCYTSKKHLVYTTTNELSNCLSRHNTEHGKGLGKKRTVVMKKDMYGNKYLQRM